MKSIAKKNEEARKIYSFIMEDDIPEPGDCNEEEPKTSPLSKVNCKDGVFKFKNIKPKQRLMTSNNLEGMAESLNFSPSKPLSSKLSENSVHIGIEKVKPLQPSDVDVPLDTENMVENEEDISKINYNFKKVFSKYELIPINKTEINQYYSFIALLGKGAFGEVWEVEHTKLKQRRAIKIINKKSVKFDEECKKQFQKEMQILTQIDHPNIVRIFEIFESNDTIYLVCELIKGKMLSKKMTNQNFSEPEIAILMSQILSALNYCHKKNIVHRDLKPDNIMFESNEKDAILKIIDFGQSSFFETNQKFTGFIGTPLFMSPELVSQEGFGVKTDIWSAGIILYILLRGQLPFITSSLQILFNQIKVTKFTKDTFKTSEWDKVSEIAKDLLSRMLTYNPKYRSSAEELLYHPFLKSNSNNLKIPLNSSLQVFKNIEKYSRRRSSLKAIRGFLAANLQLSDQYKAARKLFNLMDKNKDGKLSIEEISKTLKEMDCQYMISDEKLKSLFEKMDTNKNGFIDYTEFISAATNMGIETVGECLEGAFKNLDFESKGYISTNELREQIVNEFGNVEPVVNSLIKVIDEKNEGKITKNEFIEAVNCIRNEW